MDPRIFPQERAFGFLSALETIDLLVVDEFYKASRKHDRDRAPSLIKAILKLSKKAKQRYYRAPNIKKLSDNAFTRDMEFLELLGFNTVYEATHPGRVMWPFGMGCKPTFIPMTAEEEKVRGMEFDDSVLAIECHERADYKWRCAKCGMGTGRSQRAHHAAASRRLRVHRIE